MWLKSSHKALEQAERKILTGIWEMMEHKFVPIHETRHVRTVTVNKDAASTPLVLVHGVGSGLGLWILNYEALSKNRTVHAFDMLGFGRSSRPKFSTDETEAEMELVESIEQWRQEMGFKEFIILGHSLGGFLATSYTLKYPERIRHLILADPWGFPLRPTSEQKRWLPLPWYVKCMAYLIKPFNPLAVVRMFGPWGPDVINRLRPNLAEMFNHLYQDDTVAQYIYHCNAQSPSGEAAFRSLCDTFGWAKNPMILRIKDLPADVPITMIYASGSRIDSDMGWCVKQKRPNSYVDIHMIQNAGHYLYAEWATEFNSLVNDVCNTVDEGSDRMETVKSRKKHRNSFKAFLFKVDNLKQESTRDWGGF